jgi:phospholipid/cholesterol/gamma-HCH transport system permease protein
LARDTQLTCDIDGGSAVLAGAVTIDTVGDLHRRLLGMGQGRDATVDLSAVTAFDTAGAWVLNDLRARLTAGGAQLHLTGASTAMTAVLSTVADAMPPAEPPAAPRGGPGLVGMLDTTGRSIVDGLRTVTGLLGYLGLFLARLARSIARPREFRLTSLVHHCEEVGLKAVPIVALMAFLIGVVLAFQGATQLRQFGAEVFVVDLIAVSILRELGILLTAIIVAGRTASAFTAAIGSMKMREEIDAMRTLGLDPALVLFVPRILALLLMLPILGLIANAAGLFGGALMAWIELGISPGLFQTRLVEGIAVSNLTVGLVKAPVFALIIGVVGCHAGMQVKGNAESLGRQTSKSVVAAIFAVIVADALFSIFFAQVGI